VAESKELWKRFYVEDNLIFSRSDFQSPDSSLVFEALEKVGGGVAEEARVLRDACKRRLGDAPRLRDLREGRGHAPAADNGKPAPAPAAKPGRPAPAPPPPKEAAKPKAAPKPIFAATPKPVAARATATASKQGTPASAWIPGAGAVVPPAGRATAPATSASAAKSVAATSAKSGATGPGKSTPPAATRTVTPPATSRTVTPPATLRPGSQPASRPGSQPANGWAIEWTRPGELAETHVYKVPIYEEREAPRTFLGITFGTRKEKYVERWEETVEEGGPHVTGHRAAVTALAFTADGRFLASGSRDGSLRVWNVQGGREACEPLETRSSVLGMALVPDRPMLAAVLADRRLVLWDFGFPRRVYHLEAPHRAALKGVAVSNDGRWIAAGGGRNIYLWQTVGGEAAGEIKGTTGRVDSLAFTADTGGIVCATHKSRLELFDRVTGESRWSVRTGLGRIVSLAVPTRSSGAVGGAAEGTVACWDLSDGSQQQRVRPMQDRLASLAVAPDASLLLVGFSSGKAFLTKAGAEREMAVLDGHPGPVTAAALPGSGKIAATGTVDGTVRLWMGR